MKETTNHKLRYPESGDPDTLAAYWQNLAKDTERELDAIAPKQIVGGAAGNLIIVGATGAGAFKAMKGDATLAEDGTATIANGAVTSQKAKLTAGVVAASGDMSLNEGYADVPGAKLEIEPVVASLLKVTAIFDFSIKSTKLEEAIGTVRLDAADQARPARFKLSENAGAIVERATVAQVYLLSLTAKEKHTIKLRAKRNTAGEDQVLFAEGTAFLYELIAS